METDLCAAGINNDMITSLRLCATCAAGSFLGSTALLISAAAPPDPEARPTGEARVPGEVYVERWVEPAPSFKPVEVAMVYVPPGKFAMGSGNGERGRERSESPRH